MDLKQFLYNLQSKTVLGLITILGVAVVLDLYNHLTPEMVDVLKYVGSSFMAVRAASNIGESFGNKKDV